MSSIIQSTFHNHFRTGEIWDDQVIKLLLGHCIHQHIDFSKDVLVPSPDRSQDYLSDWRNRYETSSKIGYEVIKLAFGHFISKTHTSSRFPTDPSRKTS